MKAIQQWTAVICFAALAAALARSLLPPGPMERMGRFVVGALMICAMISPLSRFVPSLRVSVPDAGSASSAQNEALSSAVDGVQEEATRKSVARLVQAELGEIGVKCKNVRVDMDRSESDRIVINKIVVTLNAKEAKEAGTAKEHLEKELGLKTEVVADGG